MSGLGTSSNTLNSNTSQSAQTNSTTGPLPASVPNVTGELGQAGGLASEIPALQNSQEENNIWTMMGNSPGNAAGYSGVLSGPAGQNVGNIAATTGAKIAGGDPTGLLGSSLSNYTGNVAPIASQNVDPSQNPEMKAMINALNDQISTSVNSQFAGAGRSLSGYNTKDLAMGLSEGEAPALLNQYNTNVGNKLAANQGILGANTGAASAMTGNMGTGVQMEAAAPTIAETVPSLLQSAAQAPFTNPAQQLGAAENLTVPLAGLGGTSQGTVNSQGTTNASGTQSASPLSQLSSLGGLLGNNSFGGLLGAALGLI